MLVGPDHDLCPSVTLEVSQFDNLNHSSSFFVASFGFKKQNTQYAEMVERLSRAEMKEFIQPRALPFPHGRCVPRADCVTSPSITTAILYLCTQPPLLNCGPKLKAPQWRHPEMSTRSYLRPVLTRDPTPSYPSLCPHTHNSHEAGAALPKVEF